MRAARERSIVAGRAPGGDPRDRAEGHQTRTDVARTRSLALPFTLTVDHAKRRVTGVGTGAITIADIALYVAERVRKDAYSYEQLIDVRNATIDIPVGESLFAAAMDARRQSRAGPIPRTAIVAQEGTATFGYARQLATQLGFGRATVEVFPEQSAAEIWLASDAEPA